MGYIRLGGNYSKWKAQFSRAYNGALQQNGALSFVFSHRANAFSKSMFSFAPSIGIETAINSKARVRAEATYEIGSNIKRKDGNSEFGWVHSAFVKLGVAYTF